MRETNTAAIYTRYSSDLQSERSIDDQVMLARAYAIRENLTVVITYEDRAISGASMAARAGLQQLMEDAARGRFSHLIVESLDRLSRDQADMATLYKRLRFHGVEIREIHGGVATPLNAAVRGLIGTIFLADLGAKTHRGLSGNIREGKSAGGKAYGYAPVPGKPGALTIVPHEADVVRRIFTLYADGFSPRAIAGMLNAEGVAGVRGGIWNASTINGSKARGNGILGNALYRGALVWNKVRMIKHPESGKRLSRVNPSGVWETKQLPELRIIDEALWAAVAARRALQDPRGHQARAPKHLLSSLLKCHCCGGSLVVRDRKDGKTRIRCSRYQESGTCANNHVYQLDRIEQGILTALRDEIENPEAIEAYVREYNAERRRLARESGQRQASTEKRLAAVTGELERTVTLMIKGLVDPERHAPRVKELEAEERALKAELAATPGADVVTLHPAAIERYRAQLDALQQSFATGAPAGTALRQLISRITIHPDYRFEIQGRLSELINAPAYPHMGGVLMVAREGLNQSPTHFYLTGTC